MNVMTILLVTLIALVALSGCSIIYQNNQVPSLGVDNGQLKPLTSKPNNVSTQANDPNKLVAPLPFKATQEATLAAIKSAVKEYGGSEIKAEQPDYLYVVFTSPLMKFHDDAEFWLDTESQLVHFRSASRAGYSDLGLNRNRYEKLTELYNSL